MNIIENYPLTSLNTFGVPAYARYFCVVSSQEELISLIKDKQMAGVPVIILGGGSNILFTKDYPGLVIKMNIKGIDVIREEEDKVYVKSGGGEVWHDLVRYCVDHNFGGIENLSLIPGTVGAAPMQNIGAYGVEIKDVFHSLEAIHLQTAEVRSFDKEECQFGYRDSIFKKELKGRYAIVSVTLCLNKNPKPDLRYGSLERTVKQMGYSEENVTIRQVSDAVIDIRNSKLPNPKEIGNAGSFFKNPGVSETTYSELQEKYEHIPGYPVGDGMVKIPAGWLIEKCGWKGKKIGNTGTYKNQALVIVNNGNATGKEIYDLSSQILKSVHDKFNIQLEREVNIM